MIGHQRLTAADVALTTVFTAYYALLGLVKISPIIGLPGQAITAAAIVAPIIGMLLGPYLGTLSAFLGGIIGFSLGSLSPLSFVSGIASTFCAGMIRTGKRAVAVGVYLVLLVLFAFFPNVGPAWVFPLELWFQILGLIILASPFQSIASRFLGSKSNTRLLLGFFVICLVSTLAGQIAGSLVFEAFATDPATVIGSWLTLTALYPVERIIIAVAAAFVGSSLARVLGSTHLPPTVINREKPGTHL